MIWKCSLGEAFGKQKPKTPSWGYCSHLSSSLGSAVELPDFMLEWLKWVYIVHLLCRLLCVGRRCFKRGAANSESTRSFWNALQLFCQRGERGLRLDSKDATSYLLVVCPASSVVVMPEPRKQFSCGLVWWLRVHIAPSVCGCAKLRSAGHAAGSHSAIEAEWIVAGVVSSPLFYLTCVRCLSEISVSV